MTLNRRDTLRLLGGSLAAVTASPLLACSTPPATSTINGPRRVVFFLQNHGFHPQTCLPELALRESRSLKDVELALPMQALQSYTDRMHIINGLHGRHTSPSHSAFFGALGGHRGGVGIPPRAETVDVALSRLLPQTLLPHLSIGMDSLEAMRGTPTVAKLSASGAGQPLFMHSSPFFLYQMLYGGIAEANMLKEHEAKSYFFEQLEKIAAGSGQKLPDEEAQRYQQFVGGFSEINGLRERLATVSDHLRKFAPEIDERYTKPEFETDWHDVLLDLGVSALKSGITNTLTIGSGRGEIFGSWHGLDVEETGHNLGHMPMPGNPVWDKIRQYNCRKLIKLITELESVPEGKGTMMDNTLIVYSSNNAETHHSSGKTWPFVLIGNMGGKIQTGQFTKVDGNRPINALYATLIQAVTGKSIDRFNMDESMAAKMDGGIGPLNELLG